MRKISMLILALALICQTMAASAAMAVYDATAVTKLTAELEQWTQNMTYWQKQLASIDSTDTTTLKTQISTYQTLQNELDGLLTDYNSMATNYDELYQDYTTWDSSAKTSSNYIADISTVAKAMKKAQRQALVAQGLAADTASDMSMLSTLLTASQNATGTVQAMQIANQIAALQVKQLVRLQQMMAEYNKAQLLNMRNQKQQEEQAKYGLDTMYEEVSPDSSSGSVDVTAGKSSTEDE